MLEKIKTFEDIEIHFESNPKANWEEYTLLEHLHKLSVTMIHVFVADEEKDLKFLDQAKRIFH